MSKTKIAALFVGLLLISGGMYFFSSPDTLKKIPFLQMKSEETNTPQFGSGNSETLGELSETYSNTDYGFSFKHPKEFTVTAFEEGSGTIVYLQKGGQDGFQIYITAFNETGPITVERVRQDLPTIVIESPQQVVIGGEEAFVFISSDDSIGQTREVWFVHGGYLYQITAPLSFDRDAASMMTTLQFD